MKAAAAIKFCNSLRALWNEFRASLRKEASLPKYGTRYQIRVVIFLAKPMTDESADDSLQHPENIP